MDLPHNGHFRGNGDRWGLSRFSFPDGETPAKGNQSMSATAELYKTFLENEGFRPQIDSDGDVVFKVEGRTYYIEVDDGDAEFFRIVFPNFWEIESPAELARVLFAANYATMLTKVAKVYVRSDAKNTSASIELFFEEPDQFQPVFHRAMSALRAAVNNFVEKAKE